MLTTFALVHEGSQRCFVDWLCSGVFDRFDGLRVALSEGGIGWMPFLLERIDYTLAGHQDYAGVDHLAKKPSEYYRRPHLRLPGRRPDRPPEPRSPRPSTSSCSRSTIPMATRTGRDSMRTFERLAADAQLTDDEIHGIVRNNAIDCYRLERFGLEKSVPRVGATA